MTIEIERATTTEPESPKSAHNLTKKAGLNAASYLLDFTARTVVMLLVTPILLGGLGKSLFGIWQMLLKTVSYLVTADGRPTVALKWVLVNEQSNPDHSKKQQAIGDTIGVWLLFLPFLLGLGGILVWGFPLVAKVGAADVATVRISCAILILNFAFASLVHLPETVLEGMNLRYRRMVVRTVISIVGGFASAGVVYFGLGLPGLAAAQVILSLVTSFVALTVVKSTLKWFRLVRPTWSGTKAFARISLSFFGTSIVSKLIVTCDVVVLGIVASAHLVTDYTLSSYAANVLIYTIPAILNSAVTGLGRLLREKRHDRVLELRGEMLSFGWLMMAAAGGTILVWNRSFIHMWVGLDNYAGHLADILIILLTTQFVFIQADSETVNATLRVRAKSILGLVSTALAIGLAVLLIPRYGIVGLCSGLILGRSLLSLGYPILIRRNLELGSVPAFASIARPAMVMAALYSVSAFASQEFLVTRWLVWLPGVILTFLLLLATAFRLGLPRDSRRSLVERARRLVPG
ncbi:MAG TPA: oligosaccharide flippase family protein [Fimbriimonas sp.]